MQTTPSRACSPGRARGGGARHPGTPPVACLAASLLLLGGLTTACGDSHAPSAHVGIVIGTSQANGSDLRPVYDWAVEAVNQAGGGGGRLLEATYFPVTDADLASASAQDALAARMLADPDLVAVAGLFSFEIAPKLVAAKVPYVTPVTGDDDVFRAFHDGGYVWRTLESEATMLWFLLADAKAQALAAQIDTPTVALLTGTDPYGSTFFDWYGFHATELGLSALPPVQYDQAKGTCDSSVDRLLAQGTPDFLIAVPSGPSPILQATCMVRLMQLRSPTTRLLLADSAHLPALITALGTDAEGLVGYDDAPDPASGFLTAFTQRTGLAMPDHAPNAFDAIALIGYGLEKSGGKGRAALDTGMRAIVDGDGPDTTWDAAGIKTALGLIREGQTPDIAGASGPLTFDTDFYTDPTASFFERWVVEAGAFKTTEYLTTETKANPNAATQTAIARGVKSTTPDTLQGAGGTADLPPVAANWALVIATSGSWANYRHQADALAHYQALKANGFDEDHVVLVTTDDLAGDPLNPLPGQVINVQGGPDVRASSVTDYKGAALTAAQVMTILAGGTDPALPAVLHSQSSDNIYVFIVGHGGIEGPYVGMDERSSEIIDLDHFISPTLFAATVQQMHDQHKFRRMFIGIDACHSGVVGPAFDAMGTPDVIVFTAAADIESSFSTNYAASVKSWAADQFASSLLGRVAHAPTTTLYGQLFDDVAGSHVQVFNEQNFGDVTKIGLGEFVVPRKP